MRILVVDDHETIRRGLRILLEQHDGWEVWEACNGRKAVELAKKLLPRVVVLDLSMPEMKNGFEAIHHIKRDVPNCEVLVFTIHEAEDYIIDALRAGALGYLLKSDAAMHITVAVEALSASRPYFTSSVSKLMLDIYTARARAGASGEMAPSLDQFSIREREVMQLLAEGRSNKATAALLGISHNTVEKHRLAIMKKAGARSVAELIRFAVRKNVIQP
jgi:DNA-binding NarL/FixJ family response regulator